VNFYLDTSAIVPLFLSDEHEQAMRVWASQEARRMFVSDFASAEFVGVVSRATRTRELSNRQAQAALQDFDAWRSRSVTLRPISSMDVAACERLVRDFNLKLSVPDALHLAIAMADGTSVVTFDWRLADASRRLGHPAIVPGDEA
jgi:predicted nucleic acid-binding protein